MLFIVKVQSISARCAKRVSSSAFQSISIGFQKSSKPAALAVGGKNSARNFRFGPLSRASFASPAMATTHLLLSEGGARMNLATSPDKTGELNRSMQHHLIR